MLLFGSVPCNLHGCEKDPPESNEDSIPDYLSDSQRHSASVHRGDREGAQGAEPDVHPEEPCRGDALLPGVEDRVAQLDLRRRGRERDARPRQMGNRDLAPVWDSRPRETARSAGFTNGSNAAGTAALPSGSAGGLAPPRQSLGKSAVYCWMSIVYLKNIWDGKT